MRKSLIAGAVALSLLSPNAYALSVGSMEIDSHLGEPLDISINIESIDQDEFSTLEVSLASREMFREAGIEYPRDARKLKLELGPYDNGRVTISVKTAGAISDPFLHLLISINWSGGNILREYTALIDPTDYAIEPIAQATAPETSLGLTKAVSASSQGVAEAQFKTVEGGESLSSIAALYRPSDVTAQQSWMAIFNLNQSAFPGGNLNRLQKGARLQIPTDAQMRAVSAAEAIKQVTALTRPLVSTETTKKSAPEPRKSTAATLVVGGGGDEMAADAPLDIAQNAPLSESQTIGAPASSDGETGAISQTIKKEINDSRVRDTQLKEELIATRGENKVLTSRMARLEAQLSRMSQLLELQSNALQAINSNLEKGAIGAVIPNLTQSQLDSADTTAAAKQDNLSEASDSVEKSLSEAPAETQAVQGDEAPKTYYEELLEVAISDAPEEDVNYIEEVLGLSSTSIGQEDTNPVTAEMRAKAEVNAPAPASPAVPADEATASMLANVRASLGTVPAAQDIATPAVPSDTQIASQDPAYIDALNAEDRSQISKSEARIAELQKQLQAKIDAAQNTTTDTTSAPVSSSSSAAETVPVRIENVAQQPSDRGLMSSIIEQVSSAIGALKSMAGGMSQDVWRLIGGIAAAIIGIMVLLGIRRRRDVDEVAPAEFQGSEITDSSIDIADIATKSMQHEPDDLEGFEEELHGSSLFDLSDESFMASEVIQDDSSLFSMDDNDDSLADMDSTQIGQQSTTQSVDVDPIAEADVYLAYDRKEQAVEVLEQALSNSPNQSAVVVKLLGLYQAEDNIEDFSRLFEASAENIEDEADWNKIKLMAQEFVPGHEMLADDFDSSIPVLLDEVTDKSKTGGQSEKQMDTGIPDEAKPGLKLAASNEADAMESLNISLEEANDSESLNISLEEANDMESLNISLDEELDSAVEEINQHEPDTALALAKAYIELGEEDIAKDFLRDVISDGSAELKSEAKEMLSKLG